MEAVTFVESGMILGLGTGSTATYFIKALSKAVNQGRVKAITCVATSRKSFELARKWGLRMRGLNAVTQLDLTVDGADEFDPQLNLIKGGGGALLREKIVASISDQMIVIANSSKQVRQLGRFKLPVEVFRFCTELMMYRLKGMGLNPSLRHNPDGSIFISDNGNHIIDLSLGQIPDPHILRTRLENTPGIVDHGLFLNYADKVLMGKGDSVIRMGKDRHGPN